MAKTLQSMEEILSTLPAVRDSCLFVREVLLSNLVMVGEIPAPTYQEELRIKFIQNRFAEYDLQNASTDEKGNVVGILPGSEGERNILVTARVDTVFPATVDHTITVQPDFVSGPGAGDNALGLAVMVTLPILLELLDIDLKSNLVLLGASRSLGRGDLEGLRFFLGHTELPLRAGVDMVGFPLGRLSHDPIGVYRGEIFCAVPEEYDWARFGTIGAIAAMNEVINRILEIPLSKRPRTTIVLGSIEGGHGYSSIATSALLRFEVRTESEKMGEEICLLFEDIAAEVSSRAAAEVKVDIFARRKPGGIPYAHPLVRNARRIMRQLQIQPQQNPSSPEISAFIDQRIPAITIGITSGERPNEPDERVDIEPIFTGLAQLIGILLAIDGGLCDEQ